MANITAGMVADLRAKTGAGMMDCKKALAETDGDMEQAIDLLRKKGLAAAQKKAGRVAAEGLVAVVVDGSRGAIVEVNSETDFVARNDKFQGFVAAVAKLAVQSKDLQDLAAKFHQYYNKRRFIVDDAKVRDARLCLIGAIRTVIGNGLALMGVSAPESM